MFQKQIMISNKTGLHARPASELVELTNQFESDITIVHDDEEIDAKSIIDVLSGGIDQGTEIVLKIEGADEQEAAERICTYLLNLTE